MSARDQILEYKHSVDSVNNLALEINRQVHKSDHEVSCICL